jgi:hypothetical protein
MEQNEMQTLLSWTKSTIKKSQQIDWMNFMFCVIENANP